MATQKRKNVEAPEFLAAAGDKSHKSYADVAKALGMKANSVAVRMSQLKAKLGPDPESATDEEMDAFNAKWKEKFGHLATGQGKGRKLDLAALNDLVDSL